LRECFHISINLFSLSTAENSEGGNLCLADVFPEYQHLQVLSFNKPVAALTNACQDAQLQSLLCLI
jgi:hypothetical protein